MRAMIAVLGVSLLAMTPACAFDVRIIPPENSKNLVSAIFATAGENVELELQDGRFVISSADFAPHEKSVTRGKLVITYDSIFGEKIDREVNIELAIIDCAGSGCPNREVALPDLQGRFDAEQVIERCTSAASLFRTQSRDYLFCREVFYFLDRRNQQTSPAAQAAIYGWYRSAYALFTTYRFYGVSVVPWDAALETEMEHSLKMPEFKQAQLISDSEFRTDMAKLEQAALQGLQYVQHAREGGAMDAARAEFEQVSSVLQGFKDRNRVSALPKSDLDYFDTMSSELSRAVAQSLKTHKPGN